MTGVTPSAGATAGGTNVSITGTAFCNTTSAVKFGTNNATSFTVQSDTLISAVTPAHAAGAVNVSVTTASGTATLTNGFTYLDVVPTSKCTQSQYTLTGSDGSTWAVVDPTNLSLTFNAPFAGYAIIGGNADMWTSTAGVNQDLGIALTGGTFPTTAGQPEAWKESGGFGGTYSPNAAYVQTVIAIAFDNTYTAKLVWKSNVNAGGASIWIGAGPVGGKFSTTCISVRLVSTASASLMSKVITTQPTLPSSNGTTWTDMDTANLSAAYTPSAAGVLLVTGNSDLWTNTAGFNQDIGLTASGGSFPTTAGQPEAWKESGGFNGTFSPNAAFVQVVLPVASGTAYTLKLTWKANKNASGATLYAGAGPIGGKFSPTRLTVLFLPTGATTPIDKVSTSQYRFDNSDGSTWVAVDWNKFTLTYTPTNDCEVIVGGNVDLWTSSAGFNQDIGISATDGTVPTVGGQPEAWKESGGFNGTYSPNAAYVQKTIVLKGGQSVTFQLVWKANKNATGATIWAGAGPINSLYSPTRLTLQPIGC